MVCTGNMLGKKKPFKMHKNRCSGEGEWERGGYLWWCQRHNAIADLLLQVAGYPAVSCGVSRKNRLSYSGRLPSRNEQASSIVL